jgi:kinesin family protein 11
MTLDKTYQELTQTHEKLQITEETLQVHKYVINEKEAMEKALHQSATSLLTTLKESLRDLDGLHAKLGSKRAPHIPFTLYFKVNNFNFFLCK